jgi:hypothetical protein
MNTAGFTILAFTDIEMRAILKEKLQGFNIPHKYIDDIMNDTIMELNNDPELLFNFTKNKAEHIKDTKKTIKELNKNSKKGQLVSKAKTPTKKRTTEKAEPSPVTDYSNATELNRLNKVQLMVILKDLSKNRTDINKYAKKNEIIETIIELNATTNAHHDDNTTDDDDDENHSDNDDDDNEGSNHDDDDDNNNDDDEQELVKVTGKKIAQHQTPKKVTRKA